MHASVSLALAFAFAAGLAVAPASQAAPASLKGTVASAAEGRIEGVLISAQKRGTPINITVASDRHVRLKPATNRAAQLANAEWMASMPGASTPKPAK